MPSYAPSEGTTLTRRKATSIMQRQSWDASHESYLETQCRTCTCLGLVLETRADAHIALQVV